MLWTSGVSLSAHLRWLNISDRRRSLRTLRNANRRLCNQAFFIKIYIDEDDQLRVENNRPFEMHPDPQINANALTWAQDSNKARIETKGSSLVRGVEHRGLEPLTYCLQSSRATNCANAPWTSIV